MIDINSLAGWNKTISFPYRFITIESLNSLIHLFNQNPFIPFNQIHSSISLLCQIYSHDVEVGELMYSQWNRPLELILRQ